MAPEVANGQPYNETCDTYSFALLLWEMLSLKKPYEGCTITSLREQIYNGAHDRPIIHDCWPVPIRLLLKRSWTHNVYDRSYMGANVEILRKECVRLRDGNESGLEHTKRRSTFVFRPGKVLAHIRSSSSTVMTVSEHS